MLVGFHVGFYILRSNQHHLMAERLEGAGPVMRATAGFHGDATGWQLGNERRECRASDFATDDRFSLAIDGKDIDAVFRQIDTNGFHGFLAKLFHGVCSD